MSDDRFIDDYRTRGRFVSTPSGALFSIDQGDGTPVLLLHGIPTYSYLWRDVLPLVSSEHRVVAPDLLGFGLSEKRRDGNYSVAAQSDAIQSLLRQLEIELVAIVCHDFGALIAAEMIARDPDSCTRLVLLNTSVRQQSWGGGWSPMALLRLPFAGEVAMALSQRWMLTAAMKIYVDDHSRLTREVMRHYWWPFQHGYKQTLLNMSRSRAATEGDFARWRAALRQLDVPCLIIWGQDDPTFTLAEARDLVDLMPHAHLQILTHANHFVPEDRPIACGRLINAFLSGAL